MKVHHQQGEQKDRWKKKKDKCGEREENKVCLSELK